MMLLKDADDLSWENYMPAARMALYQQGIEYVASRMGVW